MTPRCRRPVRFGGIGLVLVVTSLLLPPALSSQEAAATVEPVYSLEVRSFSGSPLLLQLTLKDPQGQFDQVEVAGGGASLSYLLPKPERGDPQGVDVDTDVDDEVLTIPVSPFFTPGIYDLVVRLSGPELNVEVPYRVGFVDFVWGRDNFRFGNNGNFEILNGDYSLALFAWLEDRFGEIPEADRVLLVHYMYSLFGKNPGRCYAFSGTQYRYITTPEALPSYNDSVYDVRGGVERVRREMHFLQMDVIFELFLRDGTPRHGAQSRASAGREVEEILRRIETGAPVVAGFVGPELHHSMLVYGFVERLGSESIDLLVANNWKDGQDSNLHSKSAEYVRVYTGAGGGEDLLEWRGEDGPRPRQPNRFFVVDVRESYDHDRVVLDAHLSGIRRLMRREGLALLVVENAASVWLTDPHGNASGYRKWRQVDEIEGVTFERRKRAYSFEIAAETELVLHVEDEAGARIYYVDYSMGTDDETAWVTATEPPADKEERLFVLSTGEVLPPEAIDP
ncbi:MAG: hypothetical protein ACLFPV_08375 [Spirochaetaceae bacterium]